MSRKTGANTGAGTNTGAETRARAGNMTDDRTGGRVDSGVSKVGGPDGGGPEVNSCG